MLVLFARDNAPPITLSLGDLIADFDTHNSWEEGCNKGDMQAALMWRGWYEGKHKNGAYLVLDLKLLAAAKVPAAEGIGQYA